MDSRLPPELLLQTRLYFNVFTCCYWCLFISRCIIKNIILILSSYPQNLKGVEKLRINQVDLYTHNTKIMLPYHPQLFTKYIFVDFL